MNKILLAVLICFAICLDSFSQLKMIKPDLSVENSFQTINRTVTLSTDKQGKTIVHLDAKPGAGVAWIKDLHFTTGTIEFDVKGKNVVQLSFVGIAFHAIDDTTWETVYFRPFNFQAADLGRKKHAVQYISLPKFDWSYLRETYPDKYEHALLSTVDPNNWFHVKILIGSDNVKAFVNADSQPCLSVKPLTHNSSGKIGFWVGNGADGDFSNLIIKHD